MDNPYDILNLNRAKYTQAMVQNLVILRTSIKLKQAELAELIGISRQSLSAYENQLTPMSWPVFLSLFFLFSQHDVSRQLMISLGIYTKELEQLYSITYLGNLSNNTMA